MAQRPYTCFVNARLTKCTDYGRRIREVELTLPDTLIDKRHLQLPETHAHLFGKRIPVIQTHRPGNAFLAKPYGTRSERALNRLYTISDTTDTRKLCTVIDRTEDNPDTSDWWLGSDPVVNRTFIPCKVVLDPIQECLVVYEHATKQDASVELYPDGSWESLKVVVIGLSTGMTPFLAHTRYFAQHAFGTTKTRCGIVYRFIMSVQYENEIVQRDYLRSLETLYPDNFFFHPMLTQKWPADWPETQRRRITAERIAAYVKNLDTYEVWYCGGAAGRDGLAEGFDRIDLHPARFRAETW